MQILKVSDAMQPLPAAVPSHTPIGEVIDQLTDGGTDGLLVVDETDAYLGIIGAQQVEQALREDDFDAVAGDLAERQPPLSSDESLEGALGALLHDRTGLPVVAAGTEDPVGWLTHLDVLRAYNARLDQGLERAGQPDRRPARRRESPLVGSALARLRGFRVVDLEFSNSRVLVGRRLGELAWPERATVLSIRRNGDSFEPDPDLRLEQGDRLTVLVPATAVDSLADRIGEAAEHHAQAPHSL
jgi:CBS domain-containing protein